MKRIIILTFILALFVVSASADDYTTFSFNGRISKATIRNGAEFRFNDSGSITFAQLITPMFFFNVGNITKTKNGLSGGNDGKINITIKNKKVASASYITDDGTRYTFTYTYNSDGFVSKVVETRTWTTEESVFHQGSASINTNNAEKIAKQITQATARGDIDEAQRLQEKYNAAMKNTNVKVSQSSTTTKKEKHSETSSATFTYTKKDVHGNWTERIRKYNGMEFTESQVIEYTPDFLSEYEWKTSIQSSKDLEKIEAFYNALQTTDTYMKKAQELWNSLVVADVTKNYVGKNDELIKIAEKPICQSITSEKILDLVRDDIYKNQVLPERDFAKLKSISEQKTKFGPLFIGAKYDEIISLSNQFKADSINYLVSVAENYLIEKKYSDVITTSRGILVIDSDNEHAKDLLKRSTENEIADNIALANADFEAKKYDSAEKYASVVLDLDAENARAFEIVDYIHHDALTVKEKSKTIQEDDYVDFLNNNPRSAYTNEVQNKRALIASSNFNKEMPWEDVTKVADYPMDEATKKKVQSRIDHQEFLRERGSFFHFGIGVDGAVGSANSSISPGATFHVGYFCSIINFEVGVKYNYLMSTKVAFKSKDDKLGGAFEKDYLSVPLMLRWNFSKDYTSAFYLGVGADLKIADISSKMKKTDGTTKNFTIKDKKFANDKMTISPKVAIGATSKHFEGEIFAIYDKDDVFNKEYIESYVVKDDEYYLKSLSSLCDSKIYKKQITSSNFFDKCRFGLSLRYMF